MLKGIHRFISSCSVFSQAKIPHTLPVGNYSKTPPQRPWSHITIKYVTPDLSSSQHNTVIMVSINLFSKFLHLLPLPGLPSDFEMANQMFWYFGITECVVSDRRAQFTFRVRGGFMENLSIMVSLTSGYHHQANGQVERANQEIWHFLQTFCTTNQEDWAQFLPWAEYAQNPLHYSTTKLTPYQYVLGHLGYQPPLFPWNANPTDSTAVDYWFMRSEWVWEQTCQCQNRHLTTSPTALHSLQTLPQTSTPSTLIPTHLITNHKHLDSITQPQYIKTLMPLLHC